MSYQLKIGRGARSRVHGLVFGVAACAAALSLTCAGELRISEICPKLAGNRSARLDPNGYDSGWIELWNAGSEAVNLKNYALDRTNRGKAAKAKGEYGVLPDITVPAGGYQIVYTCEDYPESVNDGATPFVTNGCVVVPFKVNPKKYPYVRLLKGGTVVDAFVIPPDLDDGESFAAAGAPFANYAGSGTSSVTITTPSAVSRVILPTPTKGVKNDMTGAVPYGPTAGPLYGVKHKLSDWQSFAQAKVGTGYEVKTMLNPLTTNALDQIADVTLVYRAFAASGMTEKRVAMTLETTDATAGATYTATVPAADLPSAGGLLQWAAVVTDAAGNAWRAPHCTSDVNGYAWYATLVEPTAAQVSEKLPTWHIFAVQDTLDYMDKQASDIEACRPNGVFCGIYDAQTGFYYDHVQIDLRGNTTQYLAKKSHSLKFLKCQPLACTNPFDGEKIECRKTSILAEHADPSRLRSCLSFYLRRQAGQKVPFCYPVRTQLNGAFYQLCFHTNRFKDELFEDYFSDDDTDFSQGHAFKNCGNCHNLYCGGDMEQQLPDPDDDADCTGEYTTFKNQFVSYVTKNHPTRSGMTASDQKVVDKAVVKTFDLPGWLNFLALSRLTQECDDCWSTLCLYYDAANTKTWTPFAYDVHQSFGAYYKDDNYGQSGPWATYDEMKCHPYYGGMRIVPRAYQNQINYANRAYECIYQSTKFRRLMARRLRTLMDELLKEPGTAQQDTPFWNDYAAKLVDAMQADDVLDRAKWGLGTGGHLYVWSGELSFAEGVDDLWNNYFAKRRQHLFVTHAATNTAFSGAKYDRAYNAMLPAKQSDIAALKGGFSIVNLTAFGSFADTEKVIIRNANDEAVDMSGWKVKGILNMTLPAGTVVDANDTITIVADRAAYIAANDTVLTDQVIVGNASADAEATTLTLKAADKTVVIETTEPPDPSRGDLAFGSFKRRVSFTINGFGAAVAGVPTLVRLSEDIAGFDYADCGADGSDLRFTDAAGNILPHEIDTWDASGESLVWVRPTTLVKGGTIHLYYCGTPNAANDPTAVWSDYAGVWHLNELSAATADYAQGDYANSTANAGLAGHLSSDSAANESGRFGKAFRINDSTVAQSGNYHLGGVWVNDPGANSVLDGTQITVSGWFKHKNFAYYWDHLFYKRTVSENTSGNTGAFAIECDRTSAIANVRGSSSTYFQATYPNDMKADWAYLTFVYDGTSAAVYQNGDLVASGTITALIDNNVPFVMGNNDNIANGTTGNCAWNGWIDEVRFSSGAKSAAWIAAEYEAMANASLLTAGTVETLKLPPKVVGGDEQGTVDVQSDRVIVTPGAGVTELTLVDAGDYAIEIPSSVTNIYGLVDTNKLIVKSGDYTVTKAFAFAPKSGGYAILLDAEATVLVDGEPIAVRPEFAVDDSAEPFEVQGDNLVFRVKSIPGLTYQVLASETPDANSFKPTEQPSGATAARCELTVPRSDEKGFYKIQVQR